MKLPHDPAPAEKQLVVCCARTAVNAQTAAKIGELAAKALDWDYVVSQAEEHTVVPLVERNLQIYAAESTPAESRAKLGTMARENAMRCLAFSAELIRVMDVLESRGIPAIPYKGPVAAAQAYGDITARQFEDLDVVLRQLDVRVADGAIRSLGYEPRLPWVHSAGAAREIIPGEYNYFHPDRRTIVELHTELTLRHFPARPDLDAFLQHRVKVNVGGREIPTFCPEDVLPVLCVHGAKDFWARLLWIADISELLRSFPELNWKLVLDTSRPLRIERMLHVGLALAEHILDAHLPAEISAAVRADSRAGEVAADIERRLFSRRASERSAAQRFRFRSHMVPGRFSGWVYSTRLALAPAEEDWPDARPPRLFAPLYAALRPLRLLRKYGWTSRT